MQLLVVFGMCVIGVLCCCASYILGYSAGYKDTKRGKCRNLS